VTDVEILRGFPFARVVDAIAARSGPARREGSSSGRCSTRRTRSRVWPIRPRRTAMTS
jgi:hypothetical protein